MTVEDRRAFFFCCRPVRWIPIPVCAGGHIRDDSGTRDMETAVSAEKTGPPARTGRPLLRVCCVTVRRILLRRGSAGCVYEAAAPQSRGSKWISGERTVPQSDGCPDGSGKIPGRIMDAGHCALRGQSVRKRRNFIRNLSGDRSGAWRAFSPPAFESFPFGISSFGFKWFQGHARIPDFQTSTTNTPTNSQEPCIIRPWLFFVGELLW